MSLTEKIVHLTLHATHCFGCFCLDGNRSHHPGKLHSKKFFLGRGQRNYDGIILILSEGDCPLDSRTPMTVKGTFLMRTIWPIGSITSEEIIDHGLSQQADLRGSVKSCWVKDRPDCNDHSRMERTSGVVPSASWTSSDFQRQFVLCPSGWELRI